MAHQLNIVGENASFFSLKELPWHNLGTILNSPPSSAEALEAAGLNFEVEKKHLYVNHLEDEYGIPQIYEYDLNHLNKMATFRTDTKKALGIVSQNYKIVQNTEAFKFFDPLIESEHFQYETAGALGYGEVVFISAKINKEKFDIPWEDHTDLDVYILLTSSHDGSSAVKVLLTPIRVVCNNTLTWALQTSNSNIISIRHTGNIGEKLEQGKRIVESVGNELVEAVRTIQEYKTREIHSNVVKGLMAHAVYSTHEDIMKYIEDPNSPELSQYSKNKVDSLVDYYYNGIGQRDIIDTKYGVINAVTGYLQNEKKYFKPETQFNNLVLNNSNMVQRTQAVLDSWYPYI